MAHVLRGFSNGADGVFIGACHLNECNYITHGNYHALTMVHLAKKLLEYVGLNPDRLRIEHMSGSESNLFVEAVNGFVQRVRELGPLGTGEGIDKGEVKSRISEVIKLVPYIKIVNQDKLAARLDTPGEYDELFTTDEIERLFRDVVSYYIEPTMCRACSICFRKCPVDAIVGGRNQIHVIDQEKCIKCGTCFEVCPSRYAAVKKISGEPVPSPIPEEARTIVRKSKEK